jgi:hypothetical protein
MKRRDLHLLHRTPTSSSFRVSPTRVFEDYQDRYGEALDNFLKPPVLPGHRNQRRSAQEMR